MFIELYDKFRVNINNISAYYPYDDTRIKMELFRPIENGSKTEILLCENETYRNEILERLDDMCDRRRIVQDHKNEGITLE